MHILISFPNLSIRRDRLIDKSAHTCNSWTRSFDFWRAVLHSKLAHQFCHCWPDVHALWNKSKSGTHISLAPAVMGAVGVTITMGSGDYFTNEFNRGGGGGVGGSGSVVRFLGEGQGGNELLSRAIWLSFGVVLGLAVVLAR